MKRISTGKYTDGRFVVERDAGSLDEYDIPVRESWFVYDSKAQNMDLVGPPDAKFEGDTLHECRGWISDRLQQEAKSALAVMN